jgi:hypothetical protein
MNRKAFRRTVDELYGLPIDRRLLMLPLFRLYRGLVLGKAGVVYRLVYTQLYIRVGVGSTRVKVRAANMLV